MGTDEITIGITCTRYVSNQMSGPGITVVYTISCFYDLRFPAPRALRGTPQSSEVYSLEQ